MSQRSYEFWQAIDGAHRVHAFRPGAMRSICGGINKDGTQEPSAEGTGLCRQCKQRMGRNELDPAAMEIEVSEVGSCSDLAKLMAQAMRIRK